DERDAVQKELASGTTTPFNVEFRIDVHSEYIWMRMKGVPVRIGGKRLVALALWDITKRMNNELQLVQARDYEVAVGARIQQALLLGNPDHSCEFYGIASMSIPSQRIDGDFFDFYPGSAGSIDLVIGDVMGKGIPAALTGAAAKNAVLRARMDITEFNGSSDFEPRKIVSKAESILSRNLMSLNTFLTLVYGRLSVRESLFRYVDCGHTSIIHYERTNGQCWRLKGADMPIGFALKQDYSQYAVPVGRGDILFLFSDGISEAANMEGEQLGEDRLMRLVKSSADLSAEALLDKIKHITFAYSAGDIRDDVTGISIKIRKSLDEVEEDQSKFPQVMSSLRKIRLFFQDCIDASDIPNLSEEQKVSIGIAVGEAAANILKYNKQDESVQCKAVFRKCGHWIQCAIYYAGEDYAWQRVESPEIKTYQTNGYGLSLINEIMDSVTVSLGSDGAARLSMLYLLNRKDLVS
ncbi:MAG: serine/threonine-protein phosphatase, partial [Spirochaetaceae bacterium]|nr:serine/threonine-protein phosphatase [Spirochaetaceae bacterium]